MPTGVSAVDYHEQTKHTRQSIRGGTGLDFDNKPRLYKIYEDVPRFSLEDSIPEPEVPAPTAITDSSPDTSNELDEGVLAGLCYYAAGITKTIRTHGHDHPFRAAACTGALYHIDLYPVCGNIGNITPGVYHYDPRNDTLGLLRDGDYRGVLAEATQNATVEDAPVTFVVTSTWWRNAWKYGARTYRHAFWDSGTMLANLLATANALNQPAETVLGFADDPITTLLGIDPSWEAPLELVAIGNRSPVPDAPDVTPIDLKTQPLNSDPIEYPLIYQAWKQSTLPDGSAAHEWPARRERPIDGRGPGEGNRRTLDPANPPNRSLHATIRHRGSCREYTRESIPFQTISTILDHGIRGITMDVREPDHGALQFVDCYCIANDITGLESGAYQYHPDTSEFELLHAGEYRDEAGQLALGQRLGADAALCVYFMTDFDDVTDFLGDRGYRAAQLEAAITAGRLYLTTYSHEHLGGTGLTFFDDLVTEFFKPRATGQTPMFLYTLGKPA